MTAKEQALYSMLEEHGFSYGCIMTSMHILMQSKEAQDMVMDYLYDNHPSEKKFVAYLAEICQFDGIE